VHIRLIAVGDRQPAWVDTAFEEYAARLPRQWQFRIDAIAADARRKGAAADAAKDVEGEKILSRARSSELLVLLDERGRQMSSRDLSGMLNDWQNAGQDIAFVIGGADGVSDPVRQRADLTWSLSTHTLPHGLARVLFIEQLYRAWSILSGHPYHRD
jgi:23S rRNA (pseudouridine1915-N3)-methyltransferase